MAIEGSAVFDLGFSTEIEAGDLEDQLPHAKSWGLVITMLLLNLVD